MRQTEGLSLWGEMGTERRMMMEILRTGKVVHVSDDIPGGNGSSNSPKLVTFESASGVTRQGVVKAISDEDEFLIQTWAIDHQTRREMAAAWVAQAVGYDRFPVACIRKLDLNNTGVAEECFVIEYMGPVGRYGDVYRSGEKIEGVGDMDAFDIIIWSVDRRGANVVVVEDKGRKVVRPIDHGGSLLSADPLSLLETSGLASVGEVSERFRNNLKRLVDSGDAREALKKRLRALIPEGDVEAMFGRMKMVSDCLEIDGDIRPLIHYYLSKQGVDDAPKEDANAEAFYRGELLS